jgi:hypothetical protein
MIAAVKIQLNFSVLVLGKMTYFTPSEAGGESIRKFKIIASFPILYKP